MAQNEFNFMDLLKDDAWFQEAVCLEESVDCDALAGLSWGTHLGTFMADPTGISQFAQLRSVVMQGWKQLVAEWNLGIGTEAAETKGQELIMKRLRQPVAEVQETLTALLAAKLSQPQGQWRMTEADHVEIRSIFRQVLTHEDWEAIAASVRDCIYAQVLQQDLTTADRH